jgi:hypothetical protein
MNNKAITIAIFSSSILFLLIIYLINDYPKHNFFLHENGMLGIEKKESLFSFKSSVFLKYEDEYGWFLSSDHEQDRLGLGSMRIDYGYTSEETLVFDYSDSDTTFFTKTFDWHQLDFFDRLYFTYPNFGWGDTTIIFNYNGEVVDTVLRK